MKNSVALLFILITWLVKNSVAQEFPLSNPGVSGARQAYAFGDKASKNTALRSSESRLSFEQNVGQADNRVKFIDRGHGYNLFLTDREAVFVFQSRKSQDVKSDSRAEADSFQASICG